MAYEWEEIKSFCGISQNIRVEVRKGRSQARSAICPGCETDQSPMFLRITAAAESVRWKSPDCTVSEISTLVASCPLSDVRPKVAFVT